MYCEYCNNRMVEDWDGEEFNGYYCENECKSNYKESLIEQIDDLLNVNADSYTKDQLENILNFIKKV